MKKLLFGGLMIVALAIYFMYFTDVNQKKLYSMDNLNLSSPVFNYTHPNFEMKYSSDWYVQSDPDVGVLVRFLGPMDPQGRASVVYVTTRNSSTIQDAIEEHLSVMNLVFSNTYILKKQEYIEDALWLYAESEDNIDPLIIEDAFVECDGTIYLVSSLTPKTLVEHLPVSRAMVNSFKCK